MPITSSNHSTTTYLTKDGSSIRERVHPLLHSNKNQSLAEAIVPAHSKTQLHFHKCSEEIYFVLQGKAEMTLDNDIFTIQAGDSIVIQPLQKHKLYNPNNEELVILCCCSPAYSHDDTFLIITD